MIGFTSDRTEEEYLRDIDGVHGWLRSGDSYEICLTTTFRSAFRSRSARCPRPPPLHLYDILRTLNPAPYSAYLHIDPDSLATAADDTGRGASLSPRGVALCCSSPERFLRVSAAGVVDSKPIKGTAARQPDAIADAAAALALSRSAKDVAENLMIVDLIRNDLSRVCEAGSVCVPRLMQVETYASVHQVTATDRPRPFIPAG